jgi:hypothetical protein
MAIGTPFRPWARAMTATDAGGFFLWIGIATVIWVVCFELVARIPIDFRELSLDTSADIAKRLRRYGRGKTGASGWDVSKRAAARRIPWLFGRGPFGAIAWRKSCSILRKARGTLLTGALIIGLLTLVSTLLDADVLGGEDRALAGLLGPALIAMVGTMYLCAGLRFDFREDLEQMEAMKAWPMPPWRLFLATLLPEVVLVSLFVAAGITARAVFTGDLHPAQLLILAVVPLIVLTWTAIDNAVYLYAPIRYTPGQDGALHHTGRAMILMVLRMLVFGVVSLGLLAALGISLLLEFFLDLQGPTVGSLMAGLGLVTLLAEITVLIWIGGRMFRRFDVARDRG